MKGLERVVLEHARNVMEQLHLVPRCRRVKLERQMGYSGSGKHIQSFTFHCGAEVSHYLRVADLK